MPKSIKISYPSVRNTNFDTETKKTEKQHSTMPIITLLSDWGSRDHYQAMVKAKIIGRMPGAVIVDIAHSIPPFNLNSASFVLRNTFAEFPRGTFHLIDIMADATIEMPHVVVLYDGHYFIGSDNGIFSLVFDHAPDRIVEIDMIQDTDTYTFATFDIFIKVVQHLDGGGTLEEVGSDREALTTRIALRPVTTPDLIKGHVIYIDHYENVITNITRPLFMEVGRKRNFVLTFGAARYSVTTISQSYKDVAPGEILAFFNATGHLEIAVSMGNAAGLLGIRHDDSVRMEFI